MGGLDCVSCVSDGLCVCSFVSLVVLCVFHLLRFVCDLAVIVWYLEAGASLEGVTVGGDRSRF